MIRLGPGRGLVTLRRRLIATMIVLVVAGLAALDIITYSSLHSYLYGRVDDQLNAAHALVDRYVFRADERGLPISAEQIQSRVSAEIYVEILDANGNIVVFRPSGSKALPDLPPRLPSPLPVQPPLDPDQLSKSHGTYRPDAASVNVPS